MHLFISYSHQDEAFAQQLTRALEQQGHDVWIDCENIKGGEAWRKSIVQGINDCDAFIVVLSPAAVTSRNVVKEVSLADERGKTIFPLIIAPCKIPEDMEYQLSGVQYIDFSSQSFNEAYNKLMVALGSTATNPPKPLVDPGQQYTPPAEQPVQQPTFQMVGRWQVQFQHMMTGITAYGEYMFNAAGEFSCYLNGPQGSIQAQGRWQLIWPQLGLQGMFSYTAMPYNMMPYGFVTQITNIGPTGFSGVTSGGEQVVFQRIA